MPKALFTLSLLLFLTSYLGAQREWKRFSPDGDAFELMVPGEMKYGEKNLLTDVGQMKILTYMLEGKKDDPNIIYLVNFVDYPDGTFHPDSTVLIQDFFNISIQTILHDLNGDLVYKSDNPISSHPGVLFRASYNNGGAIVKGKMSLVGDRFYAVQVYTLAEKSLNPDMDKFLNSFKPKI